jgi:hypothetical protein
MIRSIQDTIAILADRNCYREFVTKPAIEHNLERQLEPLVAASIVAIHVERKLESIIQPNLAMNSWLQRAALL